jgi:lipopolysaccharide/colanic/teichoic acid biosynthesis glycosyltransferase
MLVRRRWRADTDSGREDNVGARGNARGHGVPGGHGDAARGTQARIRRRRTVDLDLAALESEELEGVAPAEPARVRPSVDEALALARSATAPRRGLSYHTSKRVIDLILGTVLLVVMAPVIGLIALLIRLDSRGPAIFKQCRVGENGRLFRFYKFRTMRVDAVARFPHLYAYEYHEDELSTMYFKLPYDPRCTRFGNHLRRTSLDELPNLINVLRGEMTFVGPRPEIPQMLPYYAPHQYSKFAVKPGMTGLAQVSGRNILRFVETNAKDIEYVQRRSFWLDVTILFKTVGIVFLMIGAH